MLYSAPILLPLYGEPLREGAVRIEDRRISDAGKRDVLKRKYPADEERRLDDMVLMPGLINAHSHLEDGGLRDRLAFSSRPGAPLQDYLDKKKTVTALEGYNFAHLGVLESLKNGTTTLLDVSSTGASFQVLFNERLRSIIFLEFPEAAGDAAGPVFSETLAKAGGFMANDVSNWGVALPSAGPLIQLCLAYADEQNVFALSHGGSLALAPEALLRRTLFVPGPCPAEDELKRLARAGATIVICPGSYLRSGEGPLPLKRLLESGVNLCLGTESLALSESLDLFEEMYCLKKLFPELSSKALLRMTVQGGARAMGLQGVLGQIRPGFLADLIGVRTHSFDPDFIHDTLILEDVEVRFVMVNGREVLS